MIRRIVLLVGLAACDRVFAFEPVNGAAGADGSGSAGVDAHVDGPPAKVCFSDDFAGGIDPGRFTTDAPPKGGGIRQVTGGVQILWNAGFVDNYGRIATVHPYDLRGGELSVDITAFNGDLADAELFVSLDSSHYLDIGVDLRAVAFDLDDGGPGPTHLESHGYATLPLHLVMRFSDAGDTVSFDASSASASVHRDQSTPFDVSALTPALTAGTYGASTSNGDATYTSFVVKSRDCGL